MNHELPPDPDPPSVTRRRFFVGAFLGGVAAAASLPDKAGAAPAAPTPTPEPEFIPENDYPFFGAEPGSSSH